MDLVHLIYEVPDILNLATQETRKALLATSSQLHNQVRASITSVTVNPGQIELLKPANLPALTMLTLQCSIEASEMLHLSHGTWQNLASVEFDMNSLVYTCLLLMARGSWPVLQHLQLSYNSLQCKGMAALGLGNCRCSSHWT